jgi:hypothetical protein
MNYFLPRTGRSTGNAGISDNAHSVLARLLFGYEFTEWRSTDRLRQPVFGIREDKPGVRETAQTLVKEGVFCLGSFSDMSLLGSGAF